LEAEIVSAPDGIAAKLATHGFEPPTELEGWEALARMVEQEPYLLTLEEIYLWAIAWSQREIFRRRIVRGELRVHTSSEEPAKTPTDECPPGDAGVHRIHNHLADATTKIFSKDFANLVRRNLSQ
jgi:hypothetical protein